MAPLTVAAACFAGLGWYEWSRRDNAHDVRVAKLRGFNDAVEAWEGHSLPAFEMFLKPQLPQVTGLGYQTRDGPPTALPMAAVRTREIHDLSYEVRMYHPLRYEYTGPLGEPDASTYAYTETVLDSFALATSHTIRGMPEKFPLTYNITSPLGNWKQCVHNRKGAYEVSEKGRCTVYYQLSALCFAVHYVEDHWEYFGGCLHDGTSSSYIVTPAPRRDRPASVNFANVTVTLRHVDDPYLRLHKLTDGLLSFGSSRDEIGQTAMAFFAVSSVFLVLLVILFALNNMPKPVKTFSTLPSSGFGSRRAGSGVQIDIK